MKQTKQNSVVKSSLTLQDALGYELTRDEALRIIQEDAITYEKFLRFSSPVQEDILGFISGHHLMKITYDSFFHKIFSPTIHKERLESLISALLGEDVTIIEVLPREGEKMSEDGSVIIMDILVKTHNHSYVNVEMQKLGYKFPGERSDCYVADFIMRQYNKLRNERKEKFSYDDMEHFCIIILMSYSSSAFLKVAPAYIHNEVKTYDSGAEVSTLSNIKYISLDTFHKTVQNINNKLDAWLTFLSSSTPNDIVRLINAYPEFLELYKEIADFRVKPKELINMYSEALAIADRNTVKLMIDEMKEQLADLNNEIAQNAELIQEQVTTIQEQNSTIQEQSSTIMEQNFTIQEQSSTIMEQNSTIQEQSSTIMEQNSTIQEQSSTIIEQNSTIQEQSSTIIEQNSTIQEQSSTIMEQNSTIQEQSSTIMEQELALEEKDATIKKMEEELKALQQRLEMLNRD